jgi:chaperonin GroEL (HSP60 family)
MRDIPESESEIAGIVSPETTRSGPKSAREINLSAVQSVVETVRSTLGPRGKDKLIEKPDGEVLITNDSETILSETAVSNPVASLTISVAKAVGQEYHDGSTTAVILTGALLDAAESLIEQGVAPNVVARGFERARQCADRSLDDVMIPGGWNVEVLTHVAETATTGTGLGMAGSDVATLVVEAAELVRDADSFDPDRIRIVTQTGQSPATSTVSRAVALAKDPVRQAMPDEVIDGRVLFIRGSLELSDTNQKTSIVIEDVDSFTRFHEREATEIRDLAGRVVDLGADAVLCSRSIADEAQSVLSRENVLAIRQVDEDALNTIAASLGGTVVSSVTEATTDDLGSGDFRRDPDDELFCIEGNGEPRPTIIIRGPTQGMVDELSQHVETGLEIVAGASDGGVVGGAGALEVELSHRLRRAARGIDGREQLAFEAFADALEQIPQTLGENAGLDPVGALVSLRTAHASGDRWAGIGENGDIINAVDTNVYEPVEMKRQVLKSATEAATLVLRIDDVLTVDALSESLSSD